MYTIFKGLPDAKAKSIDVMEKGLVLVREWMKENMLKLNDDKTEVITFPSRHNSTKQNHPTKITIG